MRREIRRPPRRKLPRNASVLSFCHRGELAEVSPEGSKPSLAFLRELRRIDPRLELYWHPFKHHWVLYRVARRAGSPREDYMVHEFDIAGPTGQYRPPGPWVLDWLRKNDKTENGGVDPEAANRRWLRNLDRALVQGDERKERRASEWRSDIYRTAERIIGSGRFSREIRAGASTRKS